MNTCINGAGHRFRVSLLILDLMGPRRTLPIRL
jgi:hypothetical protein